MRTISATKVGHHVEHVVRSIRAGQLGGVAIDEPAAIPKRARQRALRVDRAALVMTALVGALAEFLDGISLQHSWQSPRRRDGRCVAS
jgi:hypothetical protein